MALGAPQLADPSTAPPTVPPPGRSPTPVSLTFSTRLPTVDIVVPTHNEAHVLAANITRLHVYLDRHFPLPWQITIADNGSADGTAVVARRLTRTLPAVHTLILPEPGRGGALRAAWTGSPAEIVAYMDVDLSTDLDALLPLVAPLVTGHSSIAVGSRLVRGARTRRGVKRDAISRAYNLLVRAVLRSPVRDAQCGFKAMRSSDVRSILPTVHDDGWFFDTELVVRARRAGLRVVEVPVDWVDDTDSRVRIVRTAWDDLRGVARLALWDRS